MVYFDLAWLSNKYACYTLDREDVQYDLAQSRIFS